MPCSRHGIATGLAARPDRSPSIAVTVVPPTWTAAARALMNGAGRRILGLAGPPGAGKSSLAAALVEALGPEAVVVGMDGFHLAQAELARLGRADRKGAPDTFDAAGYAALLARIRTAGPDEIVYAPAFRRDLEEPIAGAVAIMPVHWLIVTEGNYLLHDGQGWAGVLPLLDACWYVDCPDEARIARLIARHVHFGRSEPDARAWVLRSDEANAALVAAGRGRADRIVRWPPAGEV